RAGNISARSFQVGNAICRAFQPRLRSHERRCSHTAAIRCRAAAGSFCAERAYRMGRARTDDFELGPGLTGTRRPEPSEGPGGPQVLASSRSQDKAYGKPDLVCYVERVSSGEKPASARGQLAGEHSALETLPAGDAIRMPVATVRRFHLTVVEGPKVGLTYQSRQDVCSIGSHPSNDLVIEDPTVSRFHCEIRITPQGTVVRDLDSRNGTILDGVQVLSGVLRGGSLLRLGASAARFHLDSENNQLPVSDRTHFGSLVGSSLVMRTAFTLLEKAAATNATVLLEGETGTGKGVAAESIHREGARRNGPFMVVDCGAIPENLLESELFGHE